MAEPLKTFIIYASADRPLRIALERQLKPLIDNGLVASWSDGEILPGEHWDNAIKTQLLDAELFLLIISANFFNSEYIRQKEFTSALSKHERGEAVIIPVIGLDCDWEVYPQIQKLQVLPPGGIAVTDLDHWRTADKAWATVIREIRRRIQALHAERTARENRQLEEKQRLAAEKEEARHKIEAFNTQETENSRSFIPPEPLHMPIIETAALQQTDQQQQRAENARPKQSEKVRRYVVGALLVLIAGWFLIQKLAQQPDKSGFEMEHIQGGTFTLGSKDGEENEKPPHEVVLGSFDMGKYEVTQTDWFEIMKTRPSYYRNCDQCPVEQVSWDEIQEFLKEANKRFPGKNYRLPTEAEWEYAARGGTKSKPKGFKYAGADDVNAVAWYKDNSGDATHPVGGKKPNELGLFDLSGNVWEWCGDWYGDYPVDRQNNPQGPQSGSNRVFRGGSWYDVPRGCRTALRNNYSPVHRNATLGFRLVSVPMQ